MSATTALAPGFADPVLDSQAAFRQMLSAMAYPGRSFALAEGLPKVAPLNAASTALCLSLADFETPVWLDSVAAAPAAQAYLRFHCGAPLVADVRDARFAVIADPMTMPSLIGFDSGEVEYPERSATLIVQVPSLDGGPPTTWHGPGIKNAIRVAIDGLPDRFWEEWSLNAELYPLGIDVIFTCGNQLLALPRSSRVEF